MKVSIIMPCYNVANTLIRALDSIIMQKVSFDYEIIIVDDSSTDNTVEVAQNYALSHPQVIILRNEKNSGNAFSYYKGLCASKGDYFCVLDGDDYYTIPDKLQRQVDFLDSDIQEEYVGTATQYIIDLGNNMVSIPERSTYKEFSYTDLLTQYSGYYHTATYMYRNIFRGNVPAQIGDVLYRGDTPRTTFHLMYSGKKIKILDFVGSAYTFEFGGIWSSLKQKQQFEYQINYQQQHRNNVTTDFEKAAADRLIEFNTQKLAVAENDLRRYPEISIDQALKNAETYAAKFAFGQKDFVLQHAYYSEYIDSLCATLGYIDSIRNPSHIQKKVNTENLCIINGVLNPQGGGIFAEIDELINIYKNKNVYLFVTNMKQVPQEATDILGKHQNLTIICPPEGTESRLGWFKKQMVDIAPYRSYYYCSHRDVYGVALAQPGICQNIALFSFDHGYLCGISNAGLDSIIAKRSVDYWMLQKRFGSRVKFIPTWNNGATDCDNITYVPFYEHDKLITASGAARFYKVDGRPPYRYIDLIVSLLQNTGGKHYHFGELPAHAIDELKSKMNNAGLSENQFIHIPWSNNIPLDLLKNHVDIFIEPFPVVSYKLTLEVLSIGVPVIVRQGSTRMSIADFVPDDTVVWKEHSDFIDKLSSLTNEHLHSLSKHAIEYFKSHHSVSKVSEMLYENSGLNTAKRYIYPDDTLMDITSSLRLFSNNFKISIMTTAGSNMPLQTNKQDEKRKTYSTPNKTQSASHHANTSPKNPSVIDKIHAIRNSKSFKLGFICTFPLRAIKQTIKYCRSYGPVSGLRKLKNDRILFYYRSNPEDELYTLTHSAAIKAGDFLAKPYRFIRYSGRKDKVLEQLKKQEQELLELRNLVLAQSSKSLTFEKDTSDSLKYIKRIQLKTNETLEHHSKHTDEELHLLSNSLTGLTDLLSSEFTGIHHRQKEILLDIKDYHLNTKNNYLNIDKSLISVLNDLQNVLDAETSLLTIIQTEMKSAFSANQASKLQELQNEQRRLLFEIRQSASTQKESLWAHIYHDSIAESSWFKNTTMSPGRWAVGYPFLYVLYNILDYMKPKEILEMGLGQSTKMITQYAQHYPNVSHTVIEQNEDWANFFKQRSSLASNTQIHILECTLEPFKDSNSVRTYKGLQKLAKGKSYDFICIDAPSAEGMDKYSRIDVLGLLPQNINSSFVIILDDCNRIGEQNTAKEISVLLNNNGISYSHSKYQGEKSFELWVSTDFSFLCSL